MASASVLSEGQFHGTRQKRRDPTGDAKFSKIKFSGSPGDSKTMHIAGGKLPRAPEKHPHHRKAGRRTRRAR
jgi:hypothetical protein